MWEARPGPDTGFFVPLSPPLLLDRNSLPPELGRAPRLTTMDSGRPYVPLHCRGGPCLSTF